MEELKIIDARLREVVSEFEALGTPKARVVCRVLYATLGAMNGGGLGMLDKTMLGFSQIQLSILKKETA